MQPLLMKKHKYKGRLITFCGLDGCGKTTMIERLLRDLKNETDVQLTKQPTNFVRESTMFRTYMDQPDHSDFEYRSLSLLAASDRVQHTRKVIEPVLQRGGIVLSDRYFYSCLANLRARGYENDQWIYEVSQWLVKPDIAFFFDVSVEKAIERIRRRPDEKTRYIDVKLQEKLHHQYQLICNENNGVMIPTECSEQESYAMVKACVEKVINNEGV